MKTYLVSLLFSAIAFGQGGGISGAGQFGCTNTPLTGTTWNSGTANNSTQTLATNVVGSQLSVTIDQTTTLTAGAVQLQGDPGDGTPVNLESWRVVDPTTPPFAPISQPYTLQASTNKQFRIIADGYYKIILKLTTAITGSGAITPYTTVSCYPPLKIFQDTAANFNSTVIGAGTAGTANANPVTVQGIASMTKLLVTPDSVALPANQSVNTAQVAGTTTDTNSGNKSAGTQRVVLATDQPQLTNKLLVTPDALPAGSALIGEVNPVATATTTDSALGCYVQSGTGTTASTNSTSCKGSAGNFYGIRAINTTATLAYVRMYNSASAPTCSSATGFIESIPVPASATGAGVVSYLDIPIGYTTGIGFCVTGGGGNTDNTNAPAGVYITIRYK